MNAKAPKYGIEINLTLMGLRYWITEDHKRLDARKFGYAKPYFGSRQAASDAYDAHLAK
jgi:hypothetical protein